MFCFQYLFIYLILCFKQSVINYNKINNRVFNKLKKKSKDNEFNLPDVTECRTYHNVCKFEYIYLLKKM